MVDLPKELLVEILARLPVESVVRFKCVCKSWYALFENPNFVSKHSANHSEEHVILMNTTRGNSLFFLSNNCDNSDDVSAIGDLGLKCPNEDYCNHMEMLGSCNGLVFLSTSYNADIIFLCNPATREVRMLPNSTFFLNNTSNPPTICGIGFGYDPRSKDYKVVRTLSLWPDEDSSSNVHPFVVEVFSLYSDSSWREIKSSLEPQFFNVFRLGDQYLDGFYNWVGTDKYMKKKVVISFDMDNEVFQTSPIPDACDDAGDYLYLGVLKNESLALFVRPPLDAEQCFDVWVWKEFGVEESWTKLLTIGPLLGLGRPIVFWKNDKELLQEDWDGYLFSYDLATQRSRTFEPLRRLSLWRGYLHKKTLVSVKKR